MPIAVALILSSLLHVTILVMPGWELPTESEISPPMIETHLIKTIPFREPPSRLPQKLPPHLQKAAPIVAPSPNTETSSTPTPVEFPVPEVVEQPTPSPLPRTPPPWAGRGKIRYLVFYGENAFMIGEAIHEWTVEEEHYSLKSTAEPKGLAALRGKVRRQSSEGDITATGLRPRIFRDQREGRDAEVVTFDWEARRAIFTGGRAEVVLAEEAQDMLSVFYQLAWHSPSQTIDLPVATAGRIGRMMFSWIGEESLVLAEKTIPTLHLRAQQAGSVEATDVWLAPSWDGLPVKIRHTDKKGEIWEQVAQ